MTTDNPIGALQEMSQSLSCSMPMYNIIETSGQSHCPTFKIQATWKNMTSVGVASSKKEAKKQAAKQLLERFKAGNNTDDDISQSDTANSATHNNDDDNDRDHDTEQNNDTENTEVKIYTGNQIGALQEYSMIRCLGAPVYTEVEATGPSHMMKFTISCKVGEVCRNRSSKTKKDAKHQAAGEVLDELKKCISENNQQSKNGLRNNSSDK